MSDDISSLDEYRNRARIRIATDADHLTIKGSSKVTLSHAISFRLQGVEVGYLDATYDFTTMPPDYHGLALQCLLARGGMTMHLDALVRAEQEESPPEPPPKPSWWQRLWRI